MLWSKGSRRGFVFVSALFIAVLTPQYLNAWPEIMAKVPVTTPLDVAVNPATNKIYVATLSGISVIHGATNAVSTIPGSYTSFMAINPVTNRIYATTGSAVTVIDGASDTTITSLAVQGYTQDIAVNPVTNRIYVALWNAVGVIDGTTNSLKTVAAGDGAQALAVNVATNKVYVANHDSQTLSVIDGSTNQVTTVSLGAVIPVNVAVNPATNMVYVSDQGINVSVIDGSSNQLVATIQTSRGGTRAIAVNPVNNRIYVGGELDDAISVINGDTNTVMATVSNLSGNEQSMVVNRQTNLIFVSHTNGFVDVIDGASNAVFTTLTSSTNSGRLALNPMTNMVYVPNGNDNTVTVIDGSVNSVKLVNRADSPMFIGSAVNPATNRIYLVDNNYVHSLVLEVDGANDNVVRSFQVSSAPRTVTINPVTNRGYVTSAAASTVSVLDLAAGSVVATVATDKVPLAAVVNPATNKIYVVNECGLDPNCGEQSPSTVTVIDGVSHATKRITAGVYASAIAVNPVTNKIYALNTGSGTVTVIDGYTDTTTTVTAGAYPIDLVVNSNTNKIFVCNGNSVTVINGADNTTKTIAVAGYPQAIAINAVSNKVYVGKQNGGITVVDGATLATTDISLPFGPSILAVNPTTNKIYGVAYAANDSIAVVDGASNKAITLQVWGSVRQPSSTVVNPYTGKFYVPNSMNSFSVLTPNPVQTIPLSTYAKGVKDGLTDTKAKIFATRSRNNVGFTGTVTSKYTPNAPAPTALYYQLDSALGSWQQATETTNPGANPAAFQFSASKLLPGVHTLYLYSSYGEEGSSQGAGSGKGGYPQTSNLVAFPFATLAYPRMTVAKGGTGDGMVLSSDHRIECGSVCSGDYSPNSYAWLEALGTGKSRFAGWTGCDQAHGTTCMVYMNDSRQVTASFSKPKAPEPVQRPGASPAREPARQGRIVER